MQSSQVIKDAPVGEVPKKIDESSQIGEGTIVEREMTKDEAYQVRVMSMGLHKDGPQDGTLDLMNSHNCTHNYSLALARA